MIDAHAFVRNFSECRQILIDIGVQCVGPSPLTDAFRHSTQRFPCDCCRQSRRCRRRWWARIGPYCCRWSTGKHRSTPRLKISRVSTFFLPISSLHSSLFLLSCLFLLFIPYEISANCCIENRLVMLHLDSLSYKRNDISKCECRV